MQRSSVLACYYYLHGCLWGFAGDAFCEYTCSTGSIARYQERISGPLLDRIDIHVEMQTEHTTSALCLPASRSACYNSLGLLHMCGDCPQSD